jgi:nucleoside-diphosphate-sugar epimerase
MANALGSIFLTGGSGFLGSLVAAVLLAQEKRSLLLALRPTSRPFDCKARIRIALLDRDIPAQKADELLRLVTIVTMPALDCFGDLDEVASSMEVDEIIHCAGCVDYFDKRRLELGNIELTSKLLEAAVRWKVHRFVYLSTAYCAGYRSDIIPERLHAAPPRALEPTEYTRSKRMAEWLIADSGVPFLIIRPSIVIGHARTGIYRGKNYGLYQMWRAIEGLLCREYSPIWHTVAPPVPLDFVHQDAFQIGFAGIYRNAAPNALVHLVADPATRPLMRDLFWQWAEVYWPVEIHSYACVDDVPLEAIPKRQRRFLEFAAKNFEIGSWHWNFETTFMDRLRATGLPFVDATLETIARCQRRYVEGSVTIQQHMRRYAGRPGGPPRLVERYRDHPRFASLA